MQPILKPPLVYALLIKGAAKSPTKPSPSPHTHKHHKPSKIAGTAQIGEAPLRKRGHREWGETTTEKKKKRVKEEKTSTEAIPLNSIGCMSCCGPVTRQAPALPPSLPPSHSGNYDIYYRGEGRKGRRLGEEHWDMGREGLS